MNTAKTEAPATTLRGQQPKPVLTVSFPRDAISLILLLATVLRMYRLNGQSLWYDEGNSVALAQRSVTTIIHSAAADIHPPLYYIVLSFWVKIFGDGEIAVRLLSVVCGVAAVYLIYRLGRRISTEGVGILAAFLAALSPFLVYYSQEARMYMPATMLGVLSCLLLTWLHNPITPALPPARRPALVWLAYILVTAAALYTHYFAVTVVLAQFAALVVCSHIETSRERGPALPSVWFRDVLIVLAAQAAVALLYLPWLPTMLSQFSQWPAISEPYDLSRLIVRLFPIFSLGFSVQPAAAIVPLCVFAVVLLIGVVPALVGRNLPGCHYKGEPSIVDRLWHRSGYLLAIFWLIVPILTMFVLSLRRPLYNPKFLLVAAPAFCLLLARGVRWIAVTAVVTRNHNPQPETRRWPVRALAAIALAVISISSLQSLRAYYTDQRYARDDYRAVVQTIQTGERSGDAVLLNAPGQTDIFGYYYKGALPVYLLPRQRPLDEKATLAELADIAAKQGRIWVVYYGDQQADPMRVIASWLEKTAFKASDRWFGNVRLVLYAIPQASAGGMQPVNDSFGPAIRLLGYRLETVAASAGDIVPLTLFWQASSAVSERYTVFAHIIDTHNALWGQNDSEPGGGLQPTTTWRVGETVQDNYGIPVLPGTPPGSYQIEIGLYRPDSGQRLPITTSSGAALGDRILIGPLVIARPAAPPAPAALGMQHASTALMGGVRLLGYNLGKLGQDAGATEFVGGDILHLTLFWQSPSQALTDLIVSLQVRDSRGKVALQADSRPADGDYPTNTWAAGEVVRDQHRIPLSGVPAGRYSIAIEVRDGSGQRVGQAQIGEIRVQ